MTARRGWAHHTEGPGDFHVWPLNDLINHAVDGEDDCPCGPQAQPVERPDGSIGWVVMHHSLDGREAHEDSSQQADANDGAL